VRTWPELWKARIIRRKNVKSISRNSKIQFYMSWPVVQKNKRGDKQVLAYNPASFVIFK
jgi:hypothetical protein